MKARHESMFGWVVLATIAGVLVGWWLAMRRMFTREVSSAVVVADGPEVEPSKPVAVLGPETRRVPLAKRVEDYLTVREVAREASLSEKSIRREIDDGRLPVTRLRGKVTVKGSDVLAWLSARREA